ncbi:MULTISPECIES: DUF1236 domain-containing protein [unclassified Mesorhizobium]|uniref:DUF1236 domain-containing protein n=1 Tax=unclassified Mesorhizobium TaxID=325217 RepID=UPI000BAEDBE7|nr:MULTISPECIES: DUF1236 domain-containing protein [unclassified Mesorhizobium]TGT53547.1 DUF1236 domain-containing protein [Mesorhizobium sp. M00.F.Ca.ET.170.01.1.1]AZO10604.1 DUF1236 domain-containing protein [Mesorhizobium sp. M3A.F.Ca.ET.080.04.2.1]PBB88102.1 hypothetical protein CK216_06210 [Mesorhizobium sp. WSM3876]RWB66846.1 MAG: DUF1236 domain-containing protein [Mesorhizobium sp.]RWB84089.1 MAG: DUF1236 domain-containing protein [Mesorhizobium sp.]
MKSVLFPAVAGALLALSGAALADTPVSAVTDLNVRAGPGPQYPVIGVLAAGQSATLTGCIQNSKWCTIAEAGGNGWVYSDYVTGEFGGNRVVLTRRPAEANIAIVQPPADDIYTDNYTAAIVAGEPIDPIARPPAAVGTYVTTHRVDPVYLEGEVVTGATLPESVELREIPDYNYRYVYVNNQPALVDPGTRRIVYVMR